MVAGAVATPSEASTNYWPSNGWNTYKVYLSPAYHSGQNVGCSSYNEDKASEIATEAAIGYGWDLRARHYYTRVAGAISVSAKIDDSNTWGSDMHVAIHSNAKSQNCSAGTSYGGTHSIYQYTFRIPLADQFKSKIGWSSPGTGDKSCYTPTCSQYSSLGELTQTWAPAAYVETDYHTYQRGVDWLLNRTWQWRFGYAIDSYWGYHRNLIY